MRLFASLKTQEGVTSSLSQRGTVLRGLSRVSLNNAASAAVAGWRFHMTGAFTESNKKCIHEKPVLMASGFLEFLDNDVKRGCQFVLGFASSLKGRNKVEL